jgi:hypothetical protein
LLLLLRTVRYLATPIHVQSHSTLPLSEYGLS